MKLRISTIIDLPEGALIPSAKFDSAVQIAFDNVTNYVTCGHLRDALKWLAQSKENQSTEYQIFKHHKIWGKICSDLNWEYEEIPE